MIHELQSPLAKHFVNRLRDSKTDARDFRRLIGQLTLLLCDALLDSSDMHKTPLQTWQGEQMLEVVREQKLVFVTILRAGLPMLEAAMEFFPEVQAGFIAMKRDETTHEAVLYYDRVPECEGKHVVILDPMVATGGSLSDAVTLLNGKKPERITSLNVIAAPEGLDAVQRRHPNLSLYVAQVDEHLDKNKFIVPGLGDAGDRAFNTPS